MKYRDKSHFYEGPCQNGRDLGRTPSFPSLHLDHTTPFRCGDCREIRGEMGGREWSGVEGFLIISDMMKAGRNGEDRALGEAKEGS